MAAAIRETRRGVPGWRRSLGQTGGRDTGSEWVRLSVDVPAVVPDSSARVVETCLRFGLPMVLPGRRVLWEAAVRVRPGGIVLVQGPSGAGKSRVLNEISKRLPGSRRVDRVAFPADVAVVDGVAPGRPVYEAFALLAACGLGEPGLWVRSFEQLSEGERFRARLARAISLHRKGGATGPLLCDEFGASLHARLARAVAFNLRKLATRERITFVLATTRDELERDLWPDCTICLGGPEPAVQDHDSNRKRMILAGESRGPSFSLLGELAVERGRLRDYEVFASMHYRRRPVGFVSDVFVIRHTVGRALLGAVVYGHPALELAPRNLVTGGRYVRQGERLNREMRVLKRLVVHPDVRGCGVGHWLVRQTLPLVGTRFVECLASMGAVNPVFEKAGMRMVGACRPSQSTLAACTRLRETGVDPLGADFVSEVCRRPAIRQVVAREVFNWYRATTGGRQHRVHRESPAVLARTFRQLAGSQPVYFIWGASAEDWALIDAATGLERPSVGSLLAS